MTIQNLTSLVNALRAETRYAGITPETLGSLLQNIVDTMADFDPSSSIQSVTSLNSAIQLLVEDVKLDNYKTYTFTQGAWKPSGSQTSKLYLHVFFKKKTISSILVNLPATSSSTPAVAKSDIRHIQCQTNGDDLIVKGASELVAAGYSIFLFRYTVKSNRQRHGAEKYHGPKKRGWHQYTNYALGKCLNKDVIQFRVFDREHGIVEDKYTGDASNLVNINIVKKVGELIRVNVGFGKKTLDVTKRHRFKFGIGFAKPQKRYGFDFSTLVTNIAPFHVYVNYIEQENRTDVHYCL